ncbi:MAG: DUF2029 domain-containing protein [Planctomycetes bacterium]|nr:DUF2029 domain-containing protein [Planctomycetota bacterium]
MPKPEADIRQSLNRVLTPLSRVWLGYCLVMLLMATAVSLLDWVQIYRDANVYLDAARAMVNGGDIYHTEQGVRSMRPLIYPPAFAAVVGLIIPLGDPMDAAAWSASHLALLVFVFWSVARACRLHKLGAVRQFAVLAMMVVFYPMWREIIEGQANLLSIACLTGGWLLIQRKKDFAGGVLLALATHLKLIPIALLPLLLIQRNRKAAMGMAAGLVGFIFLPFIWTVQTHGFGAGLTRCLLLSGDWLMDVLKPALSHDSVGGSIQHHIPNSSFHAVLNRFFGEDTVLWGAEPEWRGPLLFALPRWLLFGLGMGIPFLMYCGACWLAWVSHRKRLSKAAAIGLAFTAAQMANMLYWEHHYLGLMLVLGPLFAVSYYTKRKKAAWYAVLPLMLVLTLPSQMLIWVVYEIDNAKWDWLKPLKMAGAPLISILVLWWTTFIIYARRALGSRKATT